MKIVVTGSAGFIGFHISKKLLQDKKNTIIGIDSISSYYSTQIKRKRLALLNKNKNFKFIKANLIKKNKIENIFEKFKPNIVLHIAGQPGVLYSFKNPNSYKINNIKATKTICAVSKKFNVKKFIFASSSSVYGDQKKFPIKESFIKKPKNYYAKTKLICEEMIKKTFLFSNTKFLIFRFFTIYGPYGRPDMFIHKLLDCIKLGKKISLHNKGQNFRDFTYIDDVVKIFMHAIKNNIESNTLNICRSKPIKTITLVDLIEKIYKKSSNKNLTGFIRGEMLKTHGSNNLLKKNIKNLKFTDVQNGLKKTILIYKRFGY